MLGVRPTRSTFAAYSLRNLGVGLGMLALAGCTTLGPVLPPSVRDAGIPLADLPPDLRTVCSPEALRALLAQPNFDFRKALDQALLWGGCSDAKVKRWIVYYDTLAVGINR